MAGDGGEYGGGVEGAVQDDGAAGHERGIGQDAREVGERRAGQEAGRLAGGFHAVVDQHPGIRGVRHPDPLGDAGRAAGVPDAPVVLGPGGARHLGGGGERGAGGEQVGAQIAGSLPQGHDLGERAPGVVEQRPCGGVECRVDQEQGGLRARGDPGQGLGGHAVVEEDHPGAEEARGVTGGEDLGAVAAEETDGPAAADAAAGEHRRHAVDGGV